MEDNENMPAQAKEESNITKKETKQHDVPFTQVPNQIMDTMPMRTPAENLVLFAICRKTYGWQKTRDQISISQIMKLTGISKQGVLNCLKSLKANLWIESDKDDYGNIIYIPLEKTKDDLLIPRIEPEKWKKISNRSKPENSGRKKGQTIGLVKPVDRSNHLTGGSQTSLPEFSENRSNHLTGGSQTIGHTKETLNKEKEEIKDKERETEDPSPFLPEKPEIPSQSGYDAFKAEYESLFLSSQKVKSESNRQGFALEQLADKLDYSLDSLRLLFGNFSKSWYGTKSIRPNPEKMLKFLTDNSDSLSSEYKGEVNTDRYKDENGKYTNQDGASEYYKKDWEEKYQKAIQQKYTPEELEEAARIF